MRPMRILIDKNSNVGDEPNGKLLWVVSPGSGEPTNWGDHPSYHLEIDHDWSDDPDKITRVAHQGGVRFVLVPDATFKVDVEAFMEHEVKAPKGMSQSEAYARLHEAGLVDEGLSNRGKPDLEGIEEYTYEEAEEIINEKHNRWAFKDARVLGFNTDVFAELEAGWNAAQVFIDFGITS